MTTKNIKNRHGQTEYVVKGSGNTIIFLHGAGASAVANWPSSIDLFAHENKVVAINLPSAGNTTWNNPSLSLEDLVEIVNDVVDVEAEGKIIIVGYSAGSVIALAFAATHPEKVSKTIAIAPWLANARQRFFFNFWSDLLLKDKSLFAAYNTLTALGINAQNNMNDQGFVDTAHVFENTGFNQDLPLFIQTLAEIDIAPYLNKIQSKTKVIGFSLDTIAPFQMAKEISALIPNAAFAEIDAGHAGPWEVTDKMNEEIQNFIS